LTSAAPAVTEGDGTAAGVNAAFAGSGGHARMARSTELRSGARYRMLNGLANE